MEYLKEFDEVIYIPDFDLAGFYASDSLKKELKNLMIIDIEFEDTDKEYISEIKNTNNKISASDYIGRYLMKYGIKSLF